MSAKDERRFIGWRELDDTGRSRARFDFRMEVLHADDATRTAMISLSPDERRYDKIKIDGKLHFLDKYLNVAIPEEEMQRMLMEQAKSLPISYAPPSVESAKRYAKDRNAALQAELKGGAYAPPSEAAVPHRDFPLGVTMQVPFLSVDICGSTLLRAADPQKFDQAYEIFFREMGTVVGQFRGNVHKATGDGFIAYIDLPGFTTACDNAVDLGLTLLQVLDELNSVLSTEGLPTLTIRVGADFGSATMRALSVPTTGFSRQDIVSDALNRSVKIQEAAGQSEFHVGYALYELLHVQWLERCEKVEDGKAELPDYPIFRLRR